MCEIAAESLDGIQHERLAIGRTQKSGRILDLPASETAYVTEVECNFIFRVNSPGI